MSDEEETEDAPLVELGEGVPVEGAPLARVASRLHWPVQKSVVRRKEGASVVRTPEGPKTIDDLLDEVEIAYFESRQEFVTACRGVTADGPIPTAE
ncbi:MAG: DUF5789 family protein [Halalkalicoccus sp.]